MKTELEQRGLELIPTGTREVRTAALDACEIRVDGDRRTFHGHAAVFDSLSVDLGGFRERIQRGAFRKVLEDRPDVRFLKNHDANLIFGRTTAGTLRLREDPTGLDTENDLPADEEGRLTESARELSIAVQRRDITGMSFAFRVRPDGEDVWTEEDGELIRTIIRFGGLFDVGPVTYPAYEGTDASMRSLLGVEVFGPQGEPREVPLLDLAWRVFRGELAASEEQRARIDRALAKLDLVSPWIAERAIGAFSREPDLQAVIQGKRVRVEDVTEDVGDGSWSLAARRRRESLHAHDLKV